MNGREIIQSILRVTTIINDALKNNDSETLKCMLKERGELLKVLEAALTDDLKHQESENIARIFDLEKENEALLSAVVEELGEKYQAHSKNKNITKKKMKNIRTYISGGTTAEISSKFNRKT